MKHYHFPKALKIAATGLLVIGIGLTGSMGCIRTPLPPIPISIDIVMNEQILAAEHAEGNGAVEKQISFFCDLFNEQELETLLAQFSNQMIADLVDVTRVDLESVTITATAGDFGEFTSATIRLERAAPVPLGAAANAAGLGTSFDVMQANPFDLLNGLQDGECGIPILRLEGAAPPTADITFDVTANVLVHTELSF